MPLAAKLWLPCFTLRLCFSCSTRRCWWGCSQPKAAVDHVVDVPEVRLSAGVEFVVAISGEVMAMPGLPRLAAVDMIDVIGTDGKIVALF